VLWLAALLVALVVVLTTTQLISIHRRQQRNHAMADWVRSQPVTFSSRTFVRRRYPLRWTQWAYRYGGGPVVSVHTRGIEVSAPQGMQLDSRTVYFKGDESRMWVDHVGWAGTPLGRRECIRLCAGGHGRAVDLALYPDAGIEQTWKALVAAGVVPVRGAIETVATEG
jgi:hypothetical protein